MIARTVEGKKLKRLAKRYAQALVDKSWMGNLQTQAERDAVNAAYVKAREKLHEEIDRLTSLSFEDGDDAVPDGEPEWWKS